MYVINCISGKQVFKLPSLPLQTKSQIHRCAQQNVILHLCESRLPLLQNKDITEYQFPNI
jgi:hypothetical protein